jgi:hypothetical protein
MSGYSPVEGEVSKQPIKGHVGIQWRAKTHVKQQSIKKVANVSQAVEKISPS